MNTKQISNIAVLSAMAIILSYFERMIPAPVPVPGIKLGLANVVVVICLYYLGPKQAFGISILRVLVVSILFGGLSSMLYSLSGGLLSFFGMVLLKKTNLFSIIGVSVFGAVLHSTGQIMMACFILDTSKLLYYLPILIMCSVIAGIITGLIAYYTLANLNTINRIS